MRTYHRSNSLIKRIHCSQYLTATEVITGFIKALRYQNSSKGTLFTSWRPTPTTRRATTNLHSSRLSWEWMSLSSVLKARRKLYPFKRRWGRFKTGPSMRRTRMQDAHPMSYWLPHSLFTAPMQVTQGQWHVSRARLKSWAEITNHRTHSKSIESHVREES